MASSRWATQPQVYSDTPSDRNTLNARCKSLGRGVPGTPVGTPPEPPGPLPENAEFWCLPAGLPFHEKAPFTFLAPLARSGLFWPPLLPWPPLGPPPPSPPWPLLAPLVPPCPSSPLCFLACPPKLAVELLYWWELRATALNPKRQWFGWWPVKAHSGREKKPSTNENCWTALQTNAFA